MSTLLRGVRPLGGDPADILVVDGVIAEIGRLDDMPDVARIDADGLIALPGLVDLHTHLREPGRDGSCATSTD